MVMTLFEWYLYFGGGVIMAALCSCYGSNMELSVRKIGIIVLLFSTLWPLVAPLTFIGAIYYTFRGDPDDDTDDGLFGKGDEPRLAMQKEELPEPRGQDVATCPSCKKADRGVLHDHGRPHFCTHCGWDWSHGTDTPQNKDTN